MKEILKWAVAIIVIAIGATGALLILAEDNPNTPLTLLGFVLYKLFSITLVLGSAFLGQLAGAYGLMPDTFMGPSADGSNKQGNTEK